MNVRHKTSTLEQVTPELRWWRFGPSPAVLQQKWTIETLHGDIMSDGVTFYTHSTYEDEWRNVPTENEYETDSDGSQEPVGAPAAGTVDADS